MIGARARALIPAGRKAGGIAIAIAIAAVLVTLVVVAAGPSDQPVRCAAGMIAMGPRCCGEGQHLEGNRCAGAPTRCAAGMEVTPAGCVRRSHPVHIEGGVLRIGPGDWEAQGVVTPYEATVAPFAIDSVEVTEDRFASCIAAGSCASVPLSGEPGRPVAGVTLAEAIAFCRWAGGSVPSRDQLAFATAGPKGRRYPWGDTGLVCRRGAWAMIDGPCAKGAVAAELAGSHPDGASPEGVFDLAGNVAEWTISDAANPGWTEVRGGSFADGSAGALRSWQRRLVPVDSRSPEIGIRCVYPAR